MAQLEYQHTTRGKKPYRLFYPLAGALYILAETTTDDETDKATIQFQNEKYFNNKWPKKKGMASTYEVGPTLKHQEHKDTRKCLNSHIDTFVPDNHKIESTTVPKF